MTQKPLRCQCHSSPPPVSRKFEFERADFLHATFLQIEQCDRKRRNAQGGSHLGSAPEANSLLRMAGWAAVLSRVCFSLRAKSSGVLYRRYRGPDRRCVPEELVIEFLNRLCGERVRSAAAVIRSLKLDWAAGEALPGIGSWRSSSTVRRGLGGGRKPQRSATVASSRSTFMPIWHFRYRVEYQRRICSALRAQAELANFFKFIDTRRCCLEARI